MKKKEVVLVLGSGGARGLAHIGVIEALHQRGYKIVEIVGCSIGAVVGGIYAAGFLDDFKKWICNLDTFGVYNLMDFTLTTQGFIKGEKVFNEIKKFVNSKPIEALNIPFKAVAVDVHGQKMHVFKQGDLFTAIRASVAMPSVLTPVFIENMELVDGGVMNPLPLDLVEQGAGRLVVAVDLNHTGTYVPIGKPAKARQKELDLEASKWLSRVNKLFSDFIGPNAGKRKKHNYFELITLSFTLMQNRLTEMMTSTYTPDVLVQVPKRAADTFEFFKAHELIAYGRVQAEKLLEDLEKKQTENHG
jgi:NTE family protein